MVCIGRGRVIDSDGRGRKEETGALLRAREISALAPQTRNYLT